MAKAKTFSREKTGGGKLVTSKATNSLVRSSMDSATERLIKRQKKK